MNRIFELTNAPAFQGAFFNLSIVALFLAGGMIVVALAFYGCGREFMPDDPIEARWVLLFATLRDSFLVTILYISESFLYDMSGFQGISQFFPNSIFLYAPIAQPILSFSVHVLIFVISALRVIAISNWIVRQSR